MFQKPIKQRRISQIKIMLEKMSTTIQVKNEAHLHKVLREWFNSHLKMNELY
jgi:hypothetical protein